MKSTLKKLFSLIISVIAVFVIIIGFAPNGSTRTLFGFKSGAVYVQAIKDVCSYFSIPVCDMSDETTVPYYTTEDLKNYWRKSDGIHPNGKASEIYSFKIEEYMKKAYESYGYKWDNE